MLPFTAMIGGEFYYLASVIFVAFYSMIIIGVTQCISKHSVDPSSEREVHNEVRLNVLGPQQTVVSKMMKNLDNYKYNEANEQTR
jgi:hypothetical protein